MVLSITTGEETRKTKLYRPQGISLKRAEN